MSCHQYIDGLVQDCSNSIANALELLQSFTKPSIYFWQIIIIYCQVSNIRPTQSQHLKDSRTVL